MGRLVYKKCDNKGGKGMTYKEYREEAQKEYDALPIFWAFSDEQFEKEMNKRGLTVNDTDKIYRMKNTGGFFLRKDADQIHAFFAKPDKLSELMKDYDFAYDAILYEMNNHEYAINWQRDWDVCSVFGNVEYTEDDDELLQYFEQLGWEETTRKAYRDARKEHFRIAEEGGWF